MSRESLNRRDFSKLSVAALGGLVAGSAIGCGGGEKKDDKPAGSGDKGSDGKTSGGDEKLSGDECWVKAEKHVCRGLNTCKGKGKSGENECAGQGTCATVAAHSCAGENECACQGGCHGKIGTNSCKGEGGCHVPVHDSSWEETRAKFEAAMKKYKPEVEIGAAPAAAS